MSLWQLEEEYIQYLIRTNIAATTRSRYRGHLGRFMRHLERAGVGEPQELRREHVESFAEEITWSDNRRGGLLTIGSRNLYLIGVRGFTRWLYEQNHTAVDVGAKVAFAKKPEALPRNVPSEADMVKLLAAPSRRTVLGFRDAMVLELLYASGMRTSEVANLNVEDLDLAGGWAHVREGKNAKDRVVPLGKRTGETVRLYIENIRPQLIGNAQSNALVLNYSGGRFGATGIGRMVVRYVKAAGLGHVTAHGLRHACATHMMRRGAQIRHVQELLGHRSVTTTEVYTRLNAQEVLEAHAKFHPREQTPEQ